MNLRQQLQDLIDRGRRPGQEELDDLYNAAGPVGMDFLLGEWAGHVFGDDAPEEKLLTAIGWAGKTFRAADDVDPIVCYDPDGRRTANPVAGTAHLEPLTYRGVQTISMVYDSQPMRDHFRRIDDKTVLGAMEKDDSDQPGYFYLTRL